MDKILYSLENIKYLDSGRKIAVEGLVQNNTLMMAKDADKSM